MSAICIYNIKSNFRNEVYFCFEKYLWKLIYNNLKRYSNEINIDLKD